MLRNVVFGLKISLGPVQHGARMANMRRPAAASQVRDAVCSSNADSMRSKMYLPERDILMARLCDLSDKTEGEQVCLADHNAFCGKVESTRQ